MPRASQYSTISESNFSLGLDQQSSEGQIRPGFYELSKNMDPQTTGSVIKRRGYHTKGGYLPLRVQDISQPDSSGEVTVGLPGWVDLSSLGNEHIPVLLWGRSSSINNPTGIGDIKSASDNCIYTYAIPTNLYTLVGGSSYTITKILPYAGPQYIAAWAHRVSATSFYIMYGFSSNKNLVAAPYTNELILDLTTVSSGTTYQAVPIYKDLNPVSGEHYSTASIAVASGATQTTTVSAATHGITGYVTKGLHVELFAYDSGPTYLEQIKPDSVTINFSTGAVTVVWTNGTGASVDYVISISKVDKAYTGISLVNDMGTTLWRAYLNFLDYTYPMIQMYNQITGELVFPDYISFNSADGYSYVVVDSITAPTNNQWIINAVKMEPRANRLTLPELTKVVTGYNDDEPQLSIYGISLKETLAGAENPYRASWANLVDTYKDVNVQQLLSAASGIAHRCINFDDTEATTLKLTAHYPMMRSSIAVTSNIGPVFQTQLSSTLPAQAIKCDESESSGYIRGTVLTFVSINASFNTTTFSLKIPTTNRTTNGSSLAAGHILTIESGARSALVGKHRIASVFYGTGYITVSFIVRGIQADASWNDSGCSIRCGIFTQFINLATGDKYMFVTNDIIRSADIPDTERVKVVGLYSTSGIWVVDDCFNVYTLNLNTTVYGERTSYVVPLRTSASDYVTKDTLPTINGIVQGDAIYSSITGRIHRAIAVRRPDIVSGVISPALWATQSSLDYDNAANVWKFSPGYTVQAGDKFGIAGIVVSEDTNYVTVESYDEETGKATVVEGQGDLTYFTSANTTFSTTNTFWFSRNVVQLDERMTFKDDGSDTDVFYPLNRWLPIEQPYSPYHSYEKPRNTKLQYWDTHDVSMKSVMSGDRLFMTNGTEQIQKYDGSYLTRAGLPAMNPIQHISVKPGSGIPVVTGSITPSATAGQQITVTLAEYARFKVGDLWQLGSPYSGTGRVKGISPGATNGYVEFDVVDGTFSGTSVSPITTYSYVACYECRDRATGNSQTFSATMAAADQRVRLTEPSTVYISCNPMPCIPGLDYDRITCKLYRTLADGAQFILLDSKTVSFDKSDGPILFTDTRSDESLLQGKKLSDVLMSARTPLNDPSGNYFPEIEPPPIGSFVTSFNNRLVAARVSTLPTISLAVQRLVAATAASDFNGKIFRIRKDNTSASTTSNMESVLNFQFTGTLTTISSINYSAGVSFSVNTTGSHGLVAGDWVYLTASSGTTGMGSGMVGWWQINTKDSDTKFTILWNGTPSGGPSSAPNKFAAVTGYIPIYTGADDVSFSTVTGNAAATIIGVEYVLMNRFAKAINAVMSMTDLELSGQETFVPWCKAKGPYDKDRGIAELEVQFFELGIDKPTPEMIMCASSTSFELYGNGVLVAFSGGSESSVGALTLTYNSRVCWSRPGYPEVFNKPFFIDGDWVDVNAADGEGITGTLPFFGEAVSGGATGESNLVITKSHSVHLFNMDISPIPQRVESEGQGCESAGSLGRVRGGVLFANTVGLWKLEMNNALRSAVGAKLKRLWQQTVDTTEYGLDLMQAHQSLPDYQFKLSCKSKTASHCTDLVLVYNYLTETVNQEGVGAWTYYDNHDATGWCNLSGETYFCNCNRDVFQIRRYNTTYDYADDTNGYEAQFTSRASNCGEPSIRKQVSSIQIGFRYVASMNSTTVEQDIDLKGQFVMLDTARFPQDTELDYLTDILNSKSVVIRYAPANRKFLYSQLRITNSARFEPLEVVEYSYRAIGLSHKGTVQAAQTTRSS